MAWTTADIPNLTGRLAVVTRANGGLGLEVARELARKGGQVVMAVRDQAKAEAARASIRAEVPDAAPELQPLDLASLASVRQAAAAILAVHLRIDILVSNAGVMATGERRTEDGFELQLAANHLGHFALTALLLPALLQSDGARVVSVTSTGRHAGRPLDPDNPHLRGSYDPWRAYGQSKLANLHFALELDRRFRATGLPLGRGDDLTTAFADAEVVIHLAGTLQPRKPNTYAAANLGTVQATVIALAGSRVQRVVFLSFPAADPRSPNPYLQAKAQAEAVLLLRDSGIPTTILRCHHIYGPPEEPARRPGRSSPATAGASPSSGAVGSGLLRSTVRMWSRPSCTRRWTRPPRSGPSSWPAPRP